MNYLALAALAVAAFGVFLGLVAIVLVFDTRAQRRREDERKKRLWELRQ